MARDGYVLTIVVAMGAPDCTLSRSMLLSVLTSLPLFRVFPCALILKLRLCSDRVVLGRTPLNNRVPVTAFIPQS